MFIIINSCTISLSYIVIVIKMITVVITMETVYLFIGEYDSIAELSLWTFPLKAAHLQNLMYAIIKRINKMPKESIKD